MTDAPTPAEQVMQTIRRIAAARRRRVQMGLCGSRGWWLPAGENWAAWMLSGGYLRR